jgi:cytochrome c oxidase subunit 2
VRAGSLIRVLLVALLLAAAATAVAIFVPWLPDNASREGDRIDFVFWFVTAICIGIFSVVASLSVYSLFKFRAKPDDDTDGPPVHGHTGIEITWTVIPFILVLSMIIVSSVALAQNDRDPANSMRVEILGQQFAWVVAYPPEGAAEDMDGFICFNREPGNMIQFEERCKRSPNLVLPLDQPVRLHLTARDVIHSFWVPEFRQKQDAVPGLSTEITVTPTKIGNFPFICTELCGLGHALMRTRAIVMPEAEFQAWRERGVR